MKIKIGNKNKIKNSHIGHHINSDNLPKTKETFFERHPIIISFIISFLVGFILLFSFWDNIVMWIENIFLK